jgi:Tfp pilus assembly protein PilE
MTVALILIGLGLHLAVYPSWLASLRKRKDEKRRAALGERAHEAFFEERRSLEAYPQRGVWQTRLLGIAVILIAASDLASSA